MKSKIHDLRQAKAAKTREARAVYEKAATENRAMGPDEETKFNGLMDEVKALGQRVAQLEALEGAESDSVAAESDDSGDRSGRRLDETRDLPRLDGERPYSVLRAIRSVLAGRRLDGLEGEVDQALTKRNGRSARGFWVPMHSLRVNPQAARRGSRLAGRREVRALDTTAGTGSIATILDKSMIEILRNRIVVEDMGARVLTDMQGPFAIPRQNGTATGYWLAEGGAPTGSNQTIDQVAFAPKTVGAFTDYSRRFAEQTNQDAESFVREDLAAIIARMVDLGALNGSGSSNQPLGIAQNSNVPTVPIGTNGGFPTWPQIVGMESKVASSNADMGDLGYVVNAVTRGVLKTTAKIGSTFPNYLWNSDAPETPLNGYKAGVTNQLPGNLTKGTGINLSGMLFGNWGDLVIAFWSDLDVLIDPYTGSSTGAVRVVALQDCDVNVRHPESFAKTLDVQTS